MNCYLCGKKLEDRQWKIRGGKILCIKCWGKEVEKSFPKVKCPRCGKFWTGLYQEGICPECWAKEKERERLEKAETEKKEKSVSEMLKEAEDKKKEFPTFAEKSILKEVNDDDLPF